MCIKNEKLCITKTVNCVKTRNVGFKMMILQEGVNNKPGGNYE